MERNALERVTLYARYTLAPPFELFIKSISAKNHCHLYIVSKDGRYHDYQKIAD